MNKLGYRHLFLIVSMIVVGVVVGGCSKADPEPEASTPAQIEVRDILQRTTSVDHKPFVKVTIKNTGALTAYSLSSTVNVMNGDAVVASVAGDLITDINPPDLAPAAIAILTATFNTLTSHSDYTHLKFQFTWLEERSQIESTQSIDVPRSEMEED
jgi:hypothetical protein